MFSTKIIQVVETWKDTTRNRPEILHLANSVFRRRGENPVFIRNIGPQLSCMKSCIFQKILPNGAKMGDAGFTCTHAIFRDFAYRKRLNTAENPGTN